MKKLDDIEYYFLAFERDGTPQNAAATHIGIFLAWALLRGLGHARHANFDLGRLQRREITGATYLLRHCDGTLVDTLDLNAVGVAFAAGYYEHYLPEYLGLFGIPLEAPPDILATVPDSWASHDTVAALLDERLDAWLTSAGSSFARPVSPSPWEDPSMDQDAAFPAGARVRHARFGEGTVLHASTENGRPRVLVQFDGAMEKWLDVELARLERVP